MPTFEVKVEAIITYEVTVLGATGQEAERNAETCVPLHGEFRIESARALWNRDVTPLEEQIESWIEQLQARGYRVTPPTKDKGNDSVPPGHADASADQASDGDIRKDKAGEV